MKTTTMTTRLSLGKVMSIAALTLSISAGALAAPKELTILSGSPGGTWYPISAGIAEILTQEGVRTNAEVGAGLANVARISAGQAQLGVTTSTVPPVAKKGQAPFKKPINNIRGLAVIFPSYQHVGVTLASGVTSVEALKDLRINCMAIGNSTEAAFVDRLAAAGMSEDDLDCARGSHTFASNAIKDGNLDGFTLLSGFPNGTFTELFHSTDMRLLPLSKAQAEKMQASNPGYAYTTIPAGSYPGQENDIPTVRSDLVMFAQETMSDDDAYWIVKTMLDHIPELHKIHAVMRPLTANYMATMTSLPIHPGAIRAYREAGIEIPAQ
jgi:TRAP transporter TAXI family solute receptor